MNNNREESASNNQLLTILTLINMYNDNNRIINTVLRYNNDIRRSLVNVLNHETFNTNHTRQPTNNRNPYPPSMNPVQDTHSSNRVYINNIPYVIDNVEIIPETNQLPLRDSSFNTLDNLNNLDNMDNIFDSFLDPVIISPTPQQMESATRILRYGEIIHPLNETCCFTLERFQENDNVMIIRHCNHIFSRVQLTNWFQENCRCPICRYDIRDYHRLDENSTIPQGNPNNPLPNSTIFTPVYNRHVSNRPVSNRRYLNPSDVNLRRVRSRTSLLDISNNTLDNLTNIILDNLTNNSTFIYNDPSLNPHADENV